METPKEILQAAKSLISLFGSDSFKHLGEYKGQDAWLYEHPEGTFTGFPDIFLLKDGEVTPVSGFDSLQILHSFSIE